jgi:hypothetical protein
MSRRQLIRLSLIPALCLLAVACRNKGPQSTVRMADLHTEKQLLSGFYDLEGGAWRWTGKVFEVQLAVPPDARKNGGILTLQGTMTQEGLDKRGGQVKLSSAIGAADLPPMTISKAGEFVYREPVPASALDSPTITADFQVDKTFRASGDARNLGVIATVISLHAR